MKIEIGESLLYSWLRHAKGCQLVQTNWKVSYNSWDLANEELLLELMEKTTLYFQEHYDYSLFKGNASLGQVLMQAEVDVLGMAISGNETTLYGIDVAFHEAGLNYGSKDETVMRVAKKLIRTAMCLYGYFNVGEGELIFASPKINPAVVVDLEKVLPEVQALLLDAGLHFRVRVIGNEDFDELIMQPVIGAMTMISDSSELFMRSMQMYNLFAGSRRSAVRQVETAEGVIRERRPRQSSRGRVEFGEEIELTNFEGLKEMKIGALVRSTLTRMLMKHEISREEIELMQTYEYSKETFDIQYPLLVKASASGGEKVLRYWAGAVEAYGEKYFICSEWFEVPANNDRPYFMKWLGMKLQG